MSTTMDQIHHIRDMFYHQDKNISEIAIETGLNWKTVKRQESMAKNNILINEQHRYQNLQERYEEMNEFLLELLDEHKHVEENLRYLEDFILYKNLEKEFRYFKEHAPEETKTNLPFSNLVL